MTDPRIAQWITEHLGTHVHVTKSVTNAPPADLVKKFVRDVYGPQPFAREFAIGDAGVIATNLCDQEAWVAVDVQEPGFLGDIASFRSEAGDDCGIVVADLDEHLLLLKQGSEPAHFGLVSKSGLQPYARRAH